MTILLIAEAGVNHNGDIGLAKRLIGEAARAGVDFIKFQTFVAKNIVSASAPKADYQKVDSVAGETHLEMIRKLELSREDHEVLIEECRRHEIGFFSTAFDIQSFDLLLELNCLERVKIPSGELTNLPFLRHIARAGKPILMSTGMANLGEVEAAVEVFEAEGISRDMITVMHCTTEYPTPMNDVNLLAMRSMRDALGVKVGYSDHTSGIEVPIAAVALGAVVIEKHFTIDRELPGPDHKASLEPGELRAMVSSIRNIEIALGSGIKRPSEGELKNRPIARKSIVASRPIICGEIFSEKNITTKRPATGISPMLWDAVIGRAASRNFLTDEPIVI